MTFNITATPFNPNVDYFEELFALQNPWIFDIIPFPILDDDEFPIEFKQQYYWLFEWDLPSVSSETQLTPLSPDVFYDCIS